MLCNSNAARSPLPSLHLWKCFRSDICLVVLRHATKTSRTISLSSATFGCLWESLAINSLCKEYTHSEYGKVAEILPIVGTMGSALVTYDIVILQTPNLLLRCYVTSSSSCKMYTSLLHDGRSAGSSHSLHAALEYINCWILSQLMIFGIIGRHMSS